MTRMADVQAFLDQPALAVVGVSRSGKGFGNTVLKELDGKGYRLLPVHPEAGLIGGRPCSRSLADLPEKPGGVVVVVPPVEAQKVVQEAAAAGIERVWLQQGSESAEALDFCREHGIIAVAGECILMFAEPAGFIHRFHRGLWKLVGKLPK